MVDLNQIYNKDCIDFMNELESNSIAVNMIITSPPYNIGKNYGHFYNDNKPRNEYLNFIDKVAQKFMKILKDDGSLFLNVGNKPSDQWIANDVANIFRKYFVLQNTVIWNKSISLKKSDITKEYIGTDAYQVISIGHYQPVGTSQIYLNNCFEYLFHFTKSGNVKLDKRANDYAVPYQDKSNLRRYSDEDKRDRGNSWFIPYKTIQSKDERAHPAVFPITLPYFCIKLHGYDENTTVYDPFMGSGTTALACIDLGVNYLGTEINNEYIQIAESKIIKRKKERERKLIKESQNEKDETNQSILQYFK
jgi:site-specific DNA-methyltransferase (adenine-specific)